MRQGFERRRVTAVILGALLVAALAYGALAQAGPGAMRVCRPGGGYGGGTYGGGSYGGYGGGSYGGYGGGCVPNPGGGGGGTTTPTTTTNRTTTNATTTNITTPPPIVPAAPLNLSVILKLQGALSLNRLLSTGIPVTVQCNQPCTVVGSLLIPSSAAKRLHIARLVKIGSGHKKLKSAGKAKIRIKALHRAKKHLRHVRKLKGTVRLTATDPAGHKKRTSKHVTLKR